MPEGIRPAVWIMLSRGGREERRVERAGREVMSAFRKVEGDEGEDGEVGDEGGRRSRL